MMKEWVSYLWSSHEYMFALSYLILLYSPTLQQCDYNGNKIILSGLFWSKLFV